MYSPFVGRGAGPRALSGVFGASFVGRMRVAAASVISVIVFVGVMPSSVGAQEGPSAQPRERSGTVAPDDRPTAPLGSTSSRDRSGDASVEDVGTVVVSFAEGVARPSAFEGEAVRSVATTDLGVVDVPEGRTATEFAAELAARGDVATAEPNRTATRFEAPGQTDEFERIGVQDAWTRATGSSDVVVAVVDSGIDPNHPDLAGRLVTGYNFAVPGTYPIEALTPAPSEYGHGTKVAGVIAAAHGSGTAIEGVAGAGTRIMPLRVFPDGTDGAPLSDIAAAIEFAADNGADIINLSLGAPGQSTTLNDAVAYAVARGLVVLAATGNQGGFVSHSPANAPRAIGVSATNDNGDTVSFTNFGPDVDIAAPGLAIGTITPGGGTTSVSGTSFSTPMVAGVAALVKDRYPGWSGGRIVTELLLTAEDRGPVGLDDYYGFGVVDAAAALGISGRAPFVGVTPAAVDAEPNDVSSRATSASSTNSGVIAPEGDVDWWSFTAAQNSEVTVTLTPPTGATGPELDAVLEIHAADGTLIDVVDATLDGEVEQTTFTASASGTHRVSVRNYRGTISPGAYTLQISDSGAGAAGTAAPAAVFGATGPWLESTTPAIRARGVSRTANLSVRSGRDLAVDSVGESTVVLVDGIYGNPIDASVSLAAGSDTITINPAFTLLRGRPYVLILAGVQDTSGNSMPWTTVPFSTVGSFASPTVNGDSNPVVGDFSGDGATDILYYAPGGVADDLYFGDWSGLIDGGPEHVNGIYEPFTVDLDGNGQDDIFWYAPGPAADFIWFAGATGFSSSPTSANGVYEPFTLDLNGDGFDDIVWYAPGSAQDYVWYGRPGGGHTSVRYTANGRYEPFVGDFNDDGFDDSFWYAPGTAADYIWYGKAGGGYDSVPTTVNGRYEPVSGDFDGDGFGDVLFYGRGTATDYQWLFRPGGHDSVQVTIDGTHEPESGDFNGDRFDDVFLYGPGTLPDTMLLGGAQGL